MSKKKILIVDDDHDTRRLLDLRLRRSYETAFAADAVTALTAIRTERPDLILLDVGLPGGDGFIVMDRLRQIPSLACIPVVVISGRDRNSNEQRALEAAAQAYVQKPFNRDELLAAVSGALGGETQALSS